MSAKYINVETDSEIAQVLDQAETEPVILVKGGRRFRVEKERTEERRGIHEPEGGYNAARFAETLREIAGSISVQDSERIKEYIYSARKAGSRPINDE